MNPIKDGLRSRIYQILEIAADKDKLSRLFDIFIMALIVLNVLAVIAETVNYLSIKYSAYFHYFEVFSILVFSLEYFFRVWTCVENNKYSSKLIGRLKFMTTPLAIVDLLAVLPFYLPILFAIDLRFLRAIRLIRLIRLLKIARYTEAIRTLGAVIKMKKEELLITIFTVFILLIIASSLMFYLEREVQPEAFSSIPAAFWWGVATLTTVGYGDIYPITVLGKILGAIVSLLGIGLFALPAGIIGSGFIDLLQKKKPSPIVCPHCGKLIEK